AMNGANSNVVGGNTVSERNLITANDEGVRIAGASSNNSVLGNFIGTQIDGATGLGNAQIGIFLFNSASGNTVGGTGPGAGNVIASNGIGIFVGPQNL